MSFLNSFKYAFYGIIHCIKTQRNFRFHTCAALSAAILSYKYDLSHSDKLILAFTIVFVLISEMINTAIESVVDMTTTEYNEYAKVAKDVSAGAVLVSAITASVTGMLLFYQNGRIWTIVSEYVKNPFFWFYISVGLIYIFGIPFTFWRKK